MDERCLQRHASYFFLVCVICVPYFGKFYLMKAAVLEELGRARPYAKTKPLVIQDVDLDPPGPGELLVKIKAAGL